MAKKSKDKPKKSVEAQTPENILPQNILAVGEHVEENKNIYISQPTYKEIHKFTKNKTTNESGGMLVGTVIEEFGKTNIVISGFVEAKFCEATPTTLKFTHETWEYVHSEIDKKHQDKKIVGWIHTHPDFGIFLSEYDKFIHQNFFNEEHQVAYVVDPIQNIEGFYFWIDGKIEKCKGFYIYDKTGVEITVGPEKEVEEETNRTTPFNFKNILIAVLSVVVVFLIFSNISTNNKLKEIESQQESIVNSISQSILLLQQKILSQYQEVQELNDVLKEAGIITEQADTDETEGDNEKDDGKNSDETTADNSTEPSDEKTSDTTDGTISADTTDTTDNTSDTSSASNKDSSDNTSDTSSVSNTSSTDNTSNTDSTDNTSETNSTSSTKKGESSNE